MIKKFDEFINESNERYILFIQIDEHDRRMKEHIEQIAEIGEGDNKTVLTYYNKMGDNSIWPYEAFLYPFFEKEEAETFISEISNFVDIFYHNCFPATPNNPLMKYFLK
jgi:hypothetical protein